MALPNPPTSPNGSKLFATVYDATGTNTAAPPRSVMQKTVNTEVLGCMAVGTHKDTDAFASGDPVVLCSGINGTDIVPIAVNADGEVGIHDGGNSITIDGTVSVSGTVTVGTHAVTQSGTWNVGLSAGNNNIGDVDIASIAAGTTTIGAALDGGWDNAGKAPQYGRLSDSSATTEQTLLSADASNLYNIVDVVLSIYTGSTAPAAGRNVKLRLGIAGTVFHATYIPATSEQVIRDTVRFAIPARSAVNQAITAQLSGALGTGGVFSAEIHAYKTAS